MVASERKSLIIFSAGAFFGFAPFWAPYVQTVAGHGLFVTADAIVLLGVTLLVSLLGYYLLPDFLVSGRKSAVSDWTGTSSSCQSRTNPSRIGVGLSVVILLVMVLYWINRHILHSFLSSADEHSCYFLAECLRRGKLYVDIPPLADFFKVVHVGMRDGKWYSVYPLGWPLIWAMGLNLNVVNWLNPVMSSLAVFFFYLSGTKLFGRAASILGLFVMCLNPFFLFTGASYFSHGTCLLMISIFLYSFLRWQEAYAAGKDPVGWALVCAFACGYGLMTRYLTMAAVAGLFLLYHFFPIFFEWKGWGRVSLLKIKTLVPRILLKRPQLRKSDWVFWGVVTAFMIGILWHNYLVTGKPFRAPVKYNQSWERLGFKKGHYTPVDGFFFLIARIFYLMDWFAPAFVAAYLFLVFNLRGTASGLQSQTSEDGLHKNNSLRQLFRFTMAFFAFAYFFYYSWGGNQWGPRYLWEGIPFLSIAVADWIVCHWRNGSLRMRKFLLGFAVLSLVTSGLIFAKQAEYVEESSRQRRALYDLAEQTIQRPAIVFIHGFLGDRLVLAEEDAVRNSPFLDTKILYAHDLGDRDKELMRAYPGRSYFRGIYDPKKNRAILKTISTMTV